MRTRPVRDLSRVLASLALSFGSPKNSATMISSSSSEPSLLLVTATLRGCLMLPVIRPACVKLAVSTTRTAPSASSATNSLAPVGESARPVGSEPVLIVAVTVGVAVSMLLTLTTVASARLAT